MNFYRIQIQVVTEPQCGVVTGPQLGVSSTILGPFQYIKILVVTQTLGAYCLGIYCLGSSMKPLLLGHWEPGAGAKFLSKQISFLSKQSSFFLSKQSLDLLMHPGEY